jgi:hypothetical protein
VGHGKRSKSCSKYCGPDDHGQYDTNDDHNDDHDNYDDNASADHDGYSQSS